MAEIIAQNPKKATTLLRILIIVVVLIILVGVGYYLWINYGGTAKKTQPKISYTGTGTAVPFDFLGGLPVESGAVLKDSFTADYGADQPIQRTISYYSTQTVDANFQNFFNYVAANNWIVVNKNDSGMGMKSIYATKGANILNIVINQEMPANKVLVTITYI